MDAFTERELYWHQKCMVHANAKSLEALKEDAQACLAEIPNPYAFAAKLLFKKRNSIHGGSLLSYKSGLFLFLKYLIPAATDWVLKKFTDEERNSLLTAEDHLYIKTAFNVLYLHPTKEIFALTNTLFEFSNFSSLFEPLVRDLAVEKGKYLEALNLLLALNLSSYYYIESIIFPSACFKTSCTLMKQYFEKNVDQIATFIDLIQSVAVPYQTKTFVSKLIENNGYKNISADLITYDHFIELLKKIAYQWNIDHQGTFRLQTFFKIKNDVHNRVHGNISPQELLNRMTASIEETDAASQTRLIVELLEHRLYPEANVLIEYFNMDMNQYPLELRTALLKADVRKLQTVQPPNRRDNEYKLDLQKVNYSRIYTEESFNGMLTYLKEVEGSVAVTVRRTISANKAITYCLLQLAKRNNIFLVDLIVGDFSKESWQQLGTYLNQTDILGNKMTHMVFEIPQLRDLDEPLKPKKILDLINFALYLSDNPKYRSVIAHLPKRATTLEVVFELFTKKLPPTGRSEVFDKRPLSPDGLYFLAVTTYALFDIKSCLDSRMIMNKMDPAAVELEFMNSRK